MSSACAICGCEEDQNFLFTKWGVDIFECPLCRTAAALAPAGFDPRTIYSEGYYQGARSDGYGDYAASEPVARREFRRSLGQLRKFGVAGGRLLEIGCAYGYFLKEAQADFDCVGVEISDAARERARSAGLQVFAGLDDDEVRRRGPYDALVLLDCIEHLADPAGVLRQAAGLLTDDAAALITTGDWGSSVARISGRRWRLMTPPQHLFFFSRTGMEALLAGVGFGRVSYQRPWRMVPLGLATYQLTRRLGRRWAIPAGLNRVGLPLNLFDCMRVVARRH